MQDHFNQHGAGCGPGAGLGSLPGQQLQGSAAGRLWHHSGTVPKRCRDRSGIQGGPSQRTLLEEEGCTEAQGHTRAPRTCFQPSGAHCSAPLTQGCRKTKPGCARSISLLRGRSSKGVLCSEVPPGHPSGHPMGDARQAGAGQVPSDPCPGPGPAPFSPLPPPSMLPSRLEGAAGSVPLRVR